MRLKPGLMRHQVCGEHMAVATGEAGKVFRGMIRNNATADTLLELLMEETTEEAVVEAMYQKYDADRERIAADVHQVIQHLRQAGLLQE